MSRTYRAEPQWETDAFSTSLRTGYFYSDLVFNPISIKTLHTGRKDIHCGPGLSCFNQIHEIKEYSLITSLCPREAKSPSEIGGPEIIRFIVHLQGGSSAWRSLWSILSPGWPRGTPPAAGHAPQPRGPRLPRCWPPASPRIRWHVHVDCRSHQPSYNIVRIDNSMFH